MTALFTPLSGLPKVNILPEDALVLAHTEDGFGMLSVPALRARLLLSVEQRLALLEQSAAKWLIVNQATVMAAGRRYLADARNGTFDISFPATVEVGQPFDVTVVGGSVHLLIGTYTLIGAPIPTPMTSGRVFKFIVVNPTTIVHIA